LIEINYYPPTPDIYAGVVHESDLLAIAKSFK
jgi:hypothetical protein